MHELASEALPLAMLQVLEAQEKQIKILSGEITGLAHENLRRIRELRSQLVFSESVHKVVTAMQNRVTDCILGKDMAKVVLDDVKLYRNFPNINSITEASVKAIDNLINKVKVNIESYR